MKNKPLVSCIINFLNAEKFLEEAIESVFTQTYRNWELLLVDDGSTDDSTTIARKKAEHYPEKVRYLEHEGHQNRGASAARNLGIHNARGEYIAFLDADDVYLPHKLEHQIPILVAHTEAGMLYGSSYYWYSWTGEPDDIQWDNEVEIRNVQLNTPLKSEEFLHLFIQRKVLLPPTTSLLARRGTIENIGGFEEVFRDLFDDQVFIVKMSLEAPIVLVPGFFEKYRQHQDSCTFIAQKITGEDLKMLPIYLNWIERYLAAQGIKDAKLWKILRNELFQYRHPILWDVIYHSKRIVFLMKNYGKNIQRR
jgi:glycosyltransferase involved in cell wall biosynthesis